MPESPVTSVEHLPLAVLVRVLAGELRTKEIEELCSETDKARVAAPSLPFILDMARVSFAGSMAIGVLAGLNREFHTRGQRLIFVNLQPNMCQAMELTRINRIAEIMLDVPAALRSIGGDTQSP